MYTDTTEESQSHYSNFHRWAQFVGGSLLLCNGLKNGSLLKTALGGYLAYKGVAGDRTFSEMQESWGRVMTGRAINIRSSMVINRPRHQVYAAWRKLSNIPLFMKHIIKVTEFSDQSEWELEMPAVPGKLQWKSEIVKEVDNELLSWKSLPGASIENAGKIEFHDALGKQGTLINIVLTYHAPMGKPGEKIARLFTPLFKKIILNDIRSFKDFVESATVVEQPATVYP